MSATEADTAVVMGVLVQGQEGAVEMQPIATATPVSSGTEMTLAAKVQVLRRELGLEGNMAEVVRRATQELGIAAEVEGRPLAQKVDAALAVLTPDRVANHV